MFHMAVIPIQQSRLPSSNLSSPFLLWSKYFRHILLAHSHAYLLIASRHNLFCFILIALCSNVRFDWQPGVTPKIGSGDRDESISGLLQNLSLEGLAPQWIRPRPPRLPVLEGEVRAPTLS